LPQSTAPRRAMAAGLLPCDAQRNDAGLQHGRPTFSLCGSYSSWPGPEGSRPVPARFSAPNSRRDGCSPGGCRQPLSDRAVAYDRCDAGLRN
jgi:hypothetical protein